MSCDCECGDFIVNSPSSIAKCFQDDDGNAIDVFDMAIPSTNPYREDLKAACWARWRYAPISSLCVPRWIQRLTDRCALMDRRYQLIIAEYLEQADKLASLGYGYTQTTKEVVTPTGSDVRTVSGSDSTTAEASTSEKSSSDKTTVAEGTVTGTSKDTTTQSGSNVSKRESEDMPATEGAVTATYLSARETTTDTPGVTVEVAHESSEATKPGDTTVEHSESSKDTPGKSTTSHAETVTDKPGVVTTSEGTVQYTEQGGRTGEAFKAMMDSLEDPYVRYANELRDMFLDYWALEGRGCCGC